VFNALLHQNRWRRWTFAPPPSTDRPHCMFVHLSKHVHECSPSISWPRCLGIAFDGHNGPHITRASIEPPLFHRRSRLTQAAYQGLRLHGWRFQPLSMPLCLVLCALTHVFFLWENLVLASGRHGCRSTTSLLLPCLYSLRHTRLEAHASVDALLFTLLDSFSSSTSFLCSSLSIAWGHLCSFACRFSLPSEPYILSFITLVSSRLTSFL
jgi:hypothetical protein